MMLFLITIGCLSAKYADTSESVANAQAEDEAEDETEEVETTDEDSGSAELDCSINWDGWTDGFFATYCRSCHSVTTAERYGAPEGVDFDTRDDVIRWAERIRFRVLEQETMPLGGGVIPSDLEPLDMWLQCQVER